MKMFYNLGARTFRKRACSRRYEIYLAKSRRVCYQNPERNRSSHGEESPQGCLYDTEQPESIFIECVDCERQMCFKHNLPLLFVIEMNQY